MKIRYDFVTNSSSCSFVCYGIDLSKHNVDMNSEDVKLRLFKKFKLRVSKMSDTERRKDVIKDAIKDVKTKEQILEFFDNDPYWVFDVLGLDYQSELEAIGVSTANLQSMKPNTKLKDIPFVVANILNDCLGTDVTDNDIEHFDEVYSC